MRRKVKQFIEIKDYVTLDVLIDELTSIRGNLPANAEAELRMKGDDVFGRMLCISYFRPQTPEEAKCDARYSEAYRQSSAGVLRPPRSGPGLLRSVA